MCHHPDTNGVRPEVSAKIRTQSDRGRNFHPDIGSKPVEHTSGGAFGGPCKDRCPSQGSMIHVVPESHAQSPLRNLGRTLTWNLLAERRVQPPHSSFDGHEP